MSIVEQTIQCHVDEAGQVTVNSDAIVWSWFYLLEHRINVSSWPNEFVPRYQWHPTQSKLRMDTDTDRNNVFKLKIYYPSLNLTENCLIVMRRWNYHNHEWPQSYTEIVAKIVAFIFLLVIIAVILFVVTLICSLCFCRLRVVETYQWFNTSSLFPYLPINETFFPHVTHIFEKFDGSLHLI